MHKEWIQECIHHELSVMQKCSKYIISDLMHSLMHQLRFLTHNEL